MPSYCGPPDRNLALPARNGSLERSFAGAVVGLGGSLIAGHPVGRPVITMVGPQVRWTVDRDITDEPKAPPSLEIENRTRRSRRRFSLGVETAVPLADRRAGRRGVPGSPVDERRRRISDRLRAAPRWTRFQRRGTESTDEGDDRRDRRAGTRATRPTATGRNVGPLTPTIRSRVTSPFLPGGEPASR